MGVLFVIFRKFLLIFSNMRFDFPSFPFSFPSTFVIVLLFCLNVYIRINLLIICWRASFHADLTCLTFSFLNFLVAVYNLRMIRNWTFLEVPLNFHLEFYRFWRCLLKTILAYSESSECSYLLSHSVFFFFSIEIIRLSCLLNISQMSAVFTLLEIKWVCCNLSKYVLYTFILHFPFVSLVQAAKSWGYFMVLVSFLIKFRLIIIRLWLLHYQATIYVKCFKVGGLRLLYIMQGEW